MSSQISQEEQLIELLLHLKKTTPEQARAILSSQPQIAYALIALMVKINAVDVQVLQKTVTTFSAGAQPQPPAQMQPLQPAPAIPPHLSQYRTPTPQAHTPPHAPSHTPAPSLYSNGHGRGPSSNTYSGTGSYPSPSNGYAAPPAGTGMGAGMIPDALAAIPDEQKAMIMRVIAMTPEQIHQLPPTERANIIQLRATLGLPS
ncbi:hypothetical protein SERLA73DRAFT_156149 [Serpula lacrymans var. lacrymans S7.3]|uniref:Cleavage stimulation factor subunit 2 hinge domain-containing protein n=2 Tax=Serpula lacrymans var. lacrymans TaxID=341189 RepID=F8QD75_SERL3|nr:uncharacterized protein SERLADRAFT_443468 [Serpula lacrymans var. lacrymans S7.9]EGN93546.1 hypothetical protein SERLA73DRAFT_156149 [Serpula lacrymans var. lacrymans S7.3]EGO18923.1 hypothetical protein SERLADRAFT_443468 [Serpula lacrymans var. lacrymans S7.9]